jgi:hypothetical protein
MVSEAIVISFVGLLGVVIGTILGAKLNEKTNKKNFQFKEKKEMYEKILEFLREIAHDYVNLPYTPSAKRLMNIKVAYWNFLKKNYVKYNYLSKKVAKEFLALDEEINFLPFYLEDKITSKVLDRIAKNFERRRNQIEKLVKKELT